MVMKIHTGVPGAGKTYLLVKSFTDLFCEYDSDTQRFELKPKHQDKILVSNIQGLTLNHLDLETLMMERCETLARARWFENPKSKDIGEMADVIDEFYSEFYEEKIRWFFDCAHQEFLAQKHGPLIYLIEESQRYFDTKELGRQKWVRDVLFFFERHRHMGFSILCDTQHISKIHKGIAVLFEVEVQAKPRTLSVMGEFKYNEITDGMKTNQLPIIVKPDQRIFKVYKSMEASEQIKPKKPVLKIVAFVVAVAVLGVFIIRYAINNLGPDDVIASETIAQGDQKNQSHQIKSNAAQGKRALGSSAAGAPDQPPEWVRVDYVIPENSKEILIIHPITNTIMPLLELKHPVKRVGDAIYCDVSLGL
jgi:hypothetical protein